MITGLTARFRKAFPGGFEINVDFSQPTEPFNVTALLGPSGCGKTTLLRCLAGLDHPDSGEIRFHDEVWYSSQSPVALPPQRRNIGFLFQDYALFPHLNVADNIGFSLGRLPAVRRRERVQEMLTHFELNGLELRLPGKLSGGQQQRVALARVLARKPALLLLDEPLSALDSQLRDQLRSELRRLLSGLSIPVVMVTHDRTDAMTLADRLAILYQGRIQQIGSMQDVMNRPTNAELAKMLGVETIAAGEIVAAEAGLVTVQVGSVQLFAVAPENSSRHVHVCIKGEDVAIQKSPLVPTSVRNHLAATIKSLTPHGPLVRVALDCGFELTALVTRVACDELALASGDSVMAMVKAPAIHLIPR